jgi:hypothetical protein
MLDLSPIGHKFTEKQLKCLAEYQSNGRVKERAYRAAYDCSKMPPRSVSAKCAELFAKQYMRLAIALIDAEALKEVNEKMSDDVIDNAWVLKRASMLANFNISAFIVVGDDGQAYYDFSTATDEDWYCISEYTADQVIKGSGDNKYEVDRVKIKTHCKIKALELVGRHVNVQAFKDNVAHEHTMVVFEDDFSGEEKQNDD